MAYSTRKFSGEQEKKVSKAVKGRRVLNSGAAMFCSGDVLTSCFMLECKTKVKECDSMTIKKEWVIKAKEEALANGKPFWGLAFNFGGENSENYFILPEKYFLQIKEILEGEL